MAVASNEHTSAPTPEELIATAEAIAGTLVDRQAETETRTYYAEDIHDKFREAGFYRIMTPRSFGGFEYGIDTFLRITSTLARGCPSTAWMYCLGATHALVAASLFGEQAQREIFAGTDFIAPLTIVPSGMLTRAEDGGWRLNGEWKYCSGAPYATHFIGHAIVDAGDGTPPMPSLFIAPRSVWTRLDDWGGQLGLKGSGSHSVRAIDAALPEHFVLPGVHISQTDVSDGTPGLQLHGNPQYAGGPLSFMSLEIAALSVGIARGALDAYGELLRSRTTLLPPIVSRAEDPDYQFWYGEASGLIATAQAALDGGVQQWQAACAASGFSRAADLELTTVCRHTVLLCWRAVERFLFPTAGSSAVRGGERIERVWRDLSMLHSHAGFAVFLPTVANRELTRVHFAVAGGRP